MAAASCIDAWVLAGGAAGHPHGVALVVGALLLRLKPFPLLEILGHGVQLQLHGRGVVTQRRQLGQALCARLAGRNISSSDISTLFREHLRYINLK